MSKVNPETFYEGVQAVIGWDIDGVLCPTRKIEKWLNRIAPPVIPRIQAIFQSSRGPFANRRHLASYRFLSKRTINDVAVDALISSREQAEGIFLSSGIVIRNAIYTERPVPAREIIFNQLAERLRIRKASVKVDDLVEGYFDNPFGNDHRHVKPNAAHTLEDLGIVFYLIEDKRSTAVRVKQTAPKTNVYFVVDSAGGGRFCKRNNLIPVYSPRQFVDLAFADIRKMNQD